MSPAETDKAALAEGKADFIALGRELIADPEWGLKVEAGKPVRRCLACNTCINGMRGGAPIHCVVNPWAGRETELPAKSPLTGERIGVIGEGPADQDHTRIDINANRRLGMIDILRPTCDATRRDHVDIAAQRDRAIFPDIANSATKLDPPAHVME